MTRTTSSSSVDGTTEDSRQDQTGRQSIEKMNDDGWSRTRAQAVERFLREVGAVRQGHERMTDWAYNWFNIKAIVRHWFGIHTLIQSEEWTMREGRFHVQGRGFRCWRCEYWEP